MHLSSALRSRENTTYCLTVNVFLKVEKRTKSVSYKQSSCRRNVALHILYVSESSGKDLSHRRTAPSSCYKRLVITLQLSAVPSIFVCDSCSLLNQQTSFVLSTGILGTLRGFNGMVTSLMRSARCVCFRTYDFCFNTRVWILKCCRFIQRIIYNTIV